MSRLGRALAVALEGLDGHIVEVEGDLAAGLPAFLLTGLPDTSLSESRDRVRAAASNAGCPLPAARITVNLSPASLHKTGSGFDVAVAVAALGAAGRLDPGSAGAHVHLGELGLDARLRPVRGVLPAVLAAVRAGHPDVVVPSANAAEARLVPGAVVHPAVHLLDVVRLHGGTVPEATAGGAAAVPLPLACGAARGRAAGPAPDLQDVVGQPEARLAVEVAAAGGHHLLLQGPPGAGKTMLAARLPGLLPDLTDEEAVTVTAVHSLSGTLRAGQGLIRRPPFEDPHHTATPAAVVGGGSGLLRPGAASRAHHGVLFLDEAPEFDRRVLEALRQPLERGELVIARARGVARFPARFQLVLAANPCPCGRASGKGIACSCPPTARRRYLARLSGPLLDRVDLRVEVVPVSRAQLAARGGAGDAPDSSRVVGTRVAAARAAQRARLVGSGARCNAELSGRVLRGRLRLPAACTRELDRSLDLGDVSARGYDRVLRVAWTIADLGGHEAPRAEDVDRALMLRQGIAVAA